MSSLESIPIDSTADQEMVAPPVETAPAATAVMHASIWDTDPSVVKVPMLYTPASGFSDTHKVSESAPSPPVVGYIVALPFTPQDFGGVVQHHAPFPPTKPNDQQQTSCTPALGAALGIPQIPCAYCKQLTYTGRHLETSKLSIVPPTAAMSGEDHIPAPQHIDGELFRPCLCPLYYHRGCFRDMRAGLSIFKNGSFYECPTCMFTYKLERIMGGMRSRHRHTELGANKMSLPNQPLTMGHSGGGAGPNLDELGEGDIKWIFYRKIIIMWIITIGLFVAGVAAFGGISYGIDGDDKDIPVFIEMMLTSVSFEFPSNESTQEWRENFRRPDVPVWHYYGAFGLFALCCIIILIGAVYYCICSPSNEESGGDITPPATAILCCSSEEEEQQRLQEIINARRNQQQAHLTGLSSSLRQAVGQSQSQRNTELSTYYGSQHKWYHFFACGRPTSFQYRDQRIIPQANYDTYVPQQQQQMIPPQQPQPHYSYDQQLQLQQQQQLHQQQQPIQYVYNEQGQLVPTQQYSYAEMPQMQGGYIGQPPMSDYERARQDRARQEQARQEQEEMQRQQMIIQQQKQQQHYVSHTGGSYYYSSGNRYYYNNVDDCCCVVCFCPTGRQHDRKDDCGNCNCDGGCDCGFSNTVSNGPSGGSHSNNSDDCNCNDCDCNCNGGSGGSCNCGGGDGGGIVIILLLILLIVVIIIIISAIFGLLVFLISRSFRLAGKASQLAYIQALELEDHIFVLGINETWRPVDTV